ncbi:MAG: isoprenylcysteine carboxylmethyltransferase family protein [Myxococcota bacterium]|nr:isoprenylcysteine carboxylmethyltransferase family protein [Myxococcota bacterium]
MLRPAIASLVTLAVLAAALFGSAGHWTWPAGWVVLGLFAGSMVAAFAVLPPALLQARSRAGAGVERWDLVLASLGGFFLYPATLAVAGLDAGRLSWSPPLPAALRGLGAVLFVAGYGFALQAMRANPFFETFVRVQTDRGHRVVSSGPYAWVRHPGYAGAAVAHLGLPLVAGSLAALVPAAIGVALFAHRAQREDETLARSLPGYADYRKRVRWRLVPGVW